MALQAGAAEVNLTPRLGCHLEGNLTDRVSDNIHDELYAHAVVLDDGRTRLAFCLVDLIMVSRAMTEQAKQRIQEMTGIPPEHVLISATHTHYGPSMFGALGTPAETGYAEWVPGPIADAVILADRRRQPAQLGWAFGSCEGEVFNRRWHMKDGSVKMNPGYLNPALVKPAGPTDPQFSVMIVRTPERKPIAVMGNLGLHYVGSRDGDLSADYFGFFRRAIQRCAGAEFVAFLTNGCFGDINNCDFSRPPRRAPHPYHHCERVANVAAGEAWKAWNGLWEEDWQDEPILAAALEEVEFIHRRPTAEQLDAARAYLAEHTFEDDAWAWIYANEHLRMVDMPKGRDVPIHALRVGDTGVVGLPGEVFAEIGLGIKARSPFAHTVTVGLANDTVGYVGTDQQMDWGGYEVTLCRHVTAPKGTAGAWTDTATRLLERVKQPAHVEA